MKQLSNQKVGLHSASSSAILDAFVTVMRPAEKGHVDYTIGVSDFKKAVVEALTLNRLPLSVFKASRRYCSNFSFYTDLQMWLNNSFHSFVNGVLNFRQQT